MALRSRHFLTTVYITFFAILCIIGFNCTKDNIYSPTSDGKNLIIKAERVKVIDEGSEIYYLGVSNVNENYNTLLFYTNHQEVFVYENFIPG